MARTEVTGSQIKDGSVSLTADVTGILPVGNGGTGSTTFALNSVLLGNGTGALQAVAAGTSGNVLTSNGTTWVSSPPAASGEVTLTGTQTLTNKTLTSPRVNSILDTTTAGTVAVFSGSASPVGYHRFYNTTGSTVVLQAEGSATNINHRFSSKGTGAFQFYVTAGQNTATVAGVGADGNTSLDLTSQGTGTVKANGVEVVTTTGTQTLTNKTISGASNTITNIAVTGLSATGTPSSSTYLRGDGSWQPLAGAYAALIGNGSSTSITVTHNLNTRDVVPSVFDATTFEVVECDIVLTSVNTITLTFATAPASNAYRCVVLSSGSAGLSSLSRSVTTLTGSATLGAAPSTDYLTFVGAGGAPTLPTAVGNTNRYTIKNIHTTDKTVLTTSGQTIDGAASLVVKAGDSFDLVSDGANWRIV